MAGQIERGSSTTSTRKQFMNAEEEAAQRPHFGELTRRSILSVQRRSHSSDYYLGQRNREYI